MSAVTGSSYRGKPALTLVMDIGPFLYYAGEWLKQWMSVVADAVTVVALVGAFFGWKSFAARRVAREEVRDRAMQAREAWWRRFEWAIELATSDDTVRRVTGLKALQDLAASELVTAADLELVEAIVDSNLDGRKVDKKVQSESPAPKRTRHKKHGSLR
jgi:hypothetical protein